MGGGGGLMKGGRVLALRCPPPAPIVTNLDIGRTLAYPRPIECAHLDDGLQGLQCQKIGVKKRVKTSKSTLRFVFDTLTVF